VAGGIGLLFVNGGKNLTDAALAIAQKVDNFKAGRLGQGLENIGKVVGGRTQWNTSSIV
jgi:hypothetical protein